MMMTTLKKEEMRRRKVSAQLVTKPILYSPGALRGWGVRFNGIDPCLLGWFWRCGEYFRTGLSRSSPVLCLRFPSPMGAVLHCWSRGCSRGRGSFLCRQYPELWGALQLYPSLCSGKIKTPDESPLLLPGGKTFKEV